MDTRNNIASNNMVISILGKSANAMSLLNRLSASIFTPPVSYLFFLNAQGRYIADIFLIENDEFFIASDAQTTQNLITHLKQFDLRNELVFMPTERKLGYTFRPTEYQDPRKIGYFSWNDFMNAHEYNNLLIENEMAQFQDFEYGRSIVLEFGKAANFISHTKGCYPGQELMHRTHVSGQVRKTVKKTYKGDETIVRVLRENETHVLALCRV